MIEHTYFSAPLSAAEVVGYDDIVDALDARGAGALVETDSEFLDRRNRFLDHLLARFGRELPRVRTVLASVEGSPRARAELIGTKLAFLRSSRSSDTIAGRAFDRTTDTAIRTTRSGLQQRIGLMLGLPDVTFSYHAEHDDGRARLHPPARRSYDERDLVIDAARRRRRSRSMP